MHVDRDRRFRVFRRARSGPPFYKHCGGAGRNAESGDRIPPFPLRIDSSWSSASFLLQRIVKHVRFSVGVTKNGFLVVQRLPRSSNISSWRRDLPEFAAGHRTREFFQRASQVGRCKPRFRSIVHSSAEHFQYPFVSCRYDPVLHEDGRSGGVAIKLRS
jgi:hypothetical protein